MDRAKWLEERRKGIGGSDAAKVLGISKYGGPFTVWNDKVNAVNTFQDSDAVYFGVKLESVVADTFSERTGLKVRKRNKIAYHPKLPFIMANIDREIVGGEDGLECKTTSAYKAEEWIGDALPDDYYCQVQHYCFVMNWKGCWIACLIGGQKFIYKYVPKNDAFIETLVDAESAFWYNHVVPKVAPPLGIFDDLSVVEQTSEDLIDPTPEDIEIAQQLAAVRKEEADIKKRKELLEVRLKDRIGGRSGLGGIATWNKSSPSTTTDWQAVAMDLNPSIDVIEKHTAQKEGSRRFVFKFKTMEE